MRRKKALIHHKCVLFTLVVAFVFSFVGCKTKERVEYVDRWKTEYQTIVQHDSIYFDVHDSVWQTIYQKGDTIYNTKYKERIQYKDRLVYKTDTLFRDSVRYEVKKETQIKKVVPKWCYYCLGLTCLFVIFAIVRIVRWLR